MTQQLQQDSLFKLIKNNNFNQSFIRSQQLSEIQLGYQSSIKIRQKSMDQKVKMKMISTKVDDIKVNMNCNEKNNYKGNNNGKSNTNQIKIKGNPNINNPNINNTNINNNTNTNFDINKLLTQNKIQNKPPKRFVSPFFSKQFNPFQSNLKIQAPFTIGKQNTFIHKVEVNKPTKETYILKSIRFHSQNQNQHISTQIFKRQKFYLQHINSQYCIKYYGIQKIYHENSKSIKQLKIFMQYCQGDAQWDIEGKLIMYTLRDYLNSYKFQTNYSFREFSQQIQDKNIIIVMQIMLGLYDLNSKHIIHRDLKPENILFKKDGSVRIIDFDTIHNYYEDGQHNVGTFGYRACETVLENNENQTSWLKLDVWSLGVIMYEMFNRHRNGKGQIFPYNLNELKVKYQREYSSSLNKISSEELTKKVYAEMKLQNILQKTHIFSQSLKPLSNIIDRMLQIQNLNRYSWGQIYSNKSFFIVINEILGRFNGDDQKKNKLMKILSFQKQYKQIQDSYHNFNKKYDQIVQMIEQLQGVNTLQKYLAKKKVEHKIKTNEEKNLLQNKLKTSYQQLEKLIKLSELVRLNQDQKFMNILKLISKLKYQLAFIYHANYGSRLLSISTK